MPLKLRVEPEIDSRAMSDVQDHAQSAFDGIAREISESFTSGLSAGLGSRGREIFSGITQAAAGMGTEISAGAVAAAAGIGLIVVAAEKAGEALYGVGERFDTMSDTISARTGAIGGDLDTLTNSVRNLGSITASSLEQITEITISVRQAFDAPQQQLDSLTKQIADFNRMTGDTANIREFGLVIRAFGEDAPTAGTGFEILADMARQTGIPINELTRDMAQLAPSAQQLGLSFDQTAGLVKSFNDAGINANSTMMALSIASGHFADAGINMQTGLRDTVIQMKALIDAGKENEARVLAGDVFGERAANRMVTAVRNGTLSVQSLNEGLRVTGTTIADIDKRTSDWAENWAKIKNDAASLANIVGGPLFTAFNHLLALPLDALERAPANAEAARQAAENEARKRELLLGGGPGVGGGLAAPGAGGFGTTPEDIRAKLDAEKNKASGGAGGGPQVPYPPGYGSPPAPGQSYEDWQKGQQAMEDQHAVDEAKAKLNALPPGASADQVIAAQNDLREAAARQQTNMNRPPPKGPGGSTPGFESPQVPLPPGYEGADAKQQAYLDAVHKRQEAEANLQALQQSGTATQNDMIKAQNDLVKARTDEQQAMAALTESTSKVSDSLGEIGVKLDQDFGISKGLPGLAENLVRFLGSLGAAGVEGAGRQIQSELGYPGGQGSGSGLMGILGSAGAFGPQYTEAGGGGRFANNSGGEGGAQFPFGGFPGGSFPGGYPQGESGLPITYPGGSPYPASGQPGRGGGAAPAAAVGGGNEQIVHQAMLNAGWPESEWPALRNLMMHESGFNNTAANPSGAYGMFQFMPYTWGTYGTGPRTSDPSLQAQYGMQYIRGRYGSPSAAWAQYFNHPGGEGSYSGGGGVDTVPALLEPGEHVLTTADVHAMGGQGGVYAFRQALHAQDGGSIGQGLGGGPLQSELMKGGLKPYKPGPTGQFNPNMKIDLDTITTGRDFNWDTYAALLSVAPFDFPLTRQGGGDIPKPPPGLPGAQTQASAVGQPKAMPQPPPAGVPTALPGAGAPHAPAGAGPTMIGGAEPFAGYGPGFTITGGGLIGIAESIPASLINYAIMTAAGAIPAHFGGAVGMQHGGEVIGLQGGGSPGGAVSGDLVSAAINIGIEELNRAIGFAGQAAGIGVSGLMETFLPAGASELANNNWITRFLGGIVGARPALPNIAGAAAGATSRPAPEMLGPPPLRTEHYGTHAPPGPGNVSNTGVHIENYNVIASEDRAGQDLARHQMNQWQPQSGNR